MSIKPSVLAGLDLVGCLHHCQVRFRSLACPARFLRFGLFLPLAPGEVANHSNIFRCKLLAKRSETSLTGRSSEVKVSAIFAVRCDYRTSTSHRRKWMDVIRGGWMPSEEDDKQPRLCSPPEAHQCAHRWTWCVQLKQGRRSPLGRPGNVRKVARTFSGSAVLSEAQHRKGFASPAGIAPAALDGGKVK